MKKILIGLLVLLLVCGFTIRSKAIGLDELIEPSSSQITITLPNGTVIAIPMGEDEGYGGTIYNREISFDEGIAVDGTTVIDGSGNWDGAITGTTGTLSSTLGVTGNFAVNTSKFTVAAATGNTVVAGTLGVTGATTLSDTLAVTGATTLATTTISDLTLINSTTRSTLKVGSTGTLTGCIVLGSSSATTTKNYITADGGSLTTSTTKPAGCQ